MIPFQTIGGHLHIPHFNTIFEKVKKGIVVPFIFKYEITSSATVHHMIPGIWKLDS